jgi:zinc protease
MTLVVLDTILSGASSLAVFAPPIPNATSRLYRSLVEKGLAAAVEGNLAATMDPFLYSIGITVRPDRDPAHVLRALDDEIDRLLQGPIESGELLKASKQARALFAYGSESITNQAFWLGFSEMFATYDWFEGYLERLSATTCEEALALARRIFVPSQRVVGLYAPSGNGHRG